MKERTPKHTAAVSTLERLGYTYCGGEQWKPPLGQAPDFGLVNAQRARIAELEAELEAVGAGGVSGPLMGIAAPPAAQAEGWISVDERLPAAYVTVLLTIDGKHITTGEYMHNLSCFSRDQHDDETDDSQATHWMPLPPPPTSAEGVEHG